MPRSKLKGYSPYVKSVEVMDARETVDSVYVTALVTISMGLRDRQLFQAEIEIEIPQETFSSGLNSDPTDGSRKDIVRAMEKVRDSIEPVMPQQKRENVEANIDSVIESISKDIKQERESNESSD